jgi:outer membrane protein assembly factor BamB
MRVCSLWCVAAFVCGFAVIVAAQGSPLDYTQWRGQNRDGAASDFSAPSSWPEALTRKWIVTIGEGYATPLVVGERVYAFSRRDGNEVMTALDADDGHELWRTHYPAPYAPGSPAAAHGAGPKATPLFHEGKLFTLGISGIVSALDATTGKLQWQVPAPAEPPYFSAASSPVGDKDLVIVHPGNYGPLTAFDTRTGQVRWTAGDDGFFASPIIVNLAGTRQVVSATARNVIGVSLTDGEVLWQYPFGGNGSTTPVWYGETIIVSGLDQGVVALKPGRREGKWVVDMVWTTKDVSMYLSNPVVIDDTLFGLSHRASGQFFAVDAKTGDVLWLGPPRQATNTAAVKAGELLFFLNDDAELIVARSSRTRFEPLQRYSVADSATWAQPAISGNRLFIKDVSSLALWTLN